jgi:hypothetical protein
MFALPRLMFSCSITSSVLSGSGLISSSACTWAMLRLMPHWLPNAPQAWMNLSLASWSSMRVYLDGSKICSCKLNFQIILKDFIRPSGCAFRAIS